MMKKSVALLLSGALLTGVLGIGWASAATLAPSAVMSIKVDGKALSKDGKLLITNNHAMVPANAIAHAVGANVAYDQTAKTITISKDINTYQFTVNSQTVKINGGFVTADTPASLVHGVPYIPVRFLAEQLGMEVAFDKASNSISLTSAQTPALRIVSPANGDILYTDQVKVAVTALHYQLADFRQHTQALTGQGHIHVWLDTDPTDPKLAYKMINGEPAVFDEVPPGAHKLTVQLVGNDHKPIVPEVKQQFTFTTAPAPTLAVNGHTPAPAIPASPVPGATAPSSPVSVAPAPVAKSNQVNIQSFSFTPGALTIEKGSTVTFTNLDDVVHTVTANDGSFDSGPINQKATYTMTFSKPGVYSIYCKPHTFMTGTITVK
ncbi:stalk domain-containing protein [Brevibacillus sp. NRS-1366]|uniref:stalk domain-containing protein n=1 Tax=Brevibacillus sp. NRS-1366 TaxID=3233899 RepID=UPI003D243110